MSRSLQGYVLNLAISDTAAHTSRAVLIRRIRAVSLQLVGGGTLAGAWKIEASNDYVENAQGNVEVAGTWSDVTALFKRADGTAIAAVVDGNAATETQMAQAAPFVAGAFRVTFTASAGSGTATVANAGGEF